MFNIAKKIAPLVASEITLTGKRHLLDLGGGPGTYAIHFCLNNPELKATVYDLPATRPFFQKTVAQFGLTDRIAFKAGDFVRDEIRGDYDVALLSHILHGEGPENCNKIVKKALGTLPAGGMMVIHEFILDNTMDSPLHPALFSLNMLLGTEEGQSYSERQIMDMLARAGAKDIRRLPFKIPGESGIIVAVV
jgi:precorrin-6B methylase 2